MSRNNNSEKPTYYQMPAGIPDPIDISEALGLGLAKGSAIKYIFRAGRKPGESEEKDLCKAIVCLQRRIQFIESTQNQES